ncbi:hypothetical protein HanPSC8_Chr12g0531771 [Helianthus annuus]|nr:hypothetical protein HanPSC8_Chr12g0531771 [Helianthus annuus]
MVSELRLFPVENLNIKNNHTCELMGRNWDRKSNLSFCLYRHSYIIFPSRCLL